jgi:hypothetical protein
MILLLALVAAAVVLVLIWIGLLLLGLLRHVDELDRRLTLVTAAMPGKVNRLGLPVGSVVPAFQARTIRGDEWQSSALEGQEHLILMAHPGCAPCENLVPVLATQAEERRVPRLLIASEGAPDEHPEDWRNGSLSSERVTLVLQERNSIARLMESFVTPHVFFVGSDGRILAQGVASTVEEVKAIVKTGRREGARALNGASV